MKKFQKPYALVLLMGLLQKTRASSSSSNPYQHPDITAFAFRSQSSPENDPLPSQPESQYTSEDLDESPVVASSALLYEGGCVVSAEAIMCAGGEDSFSGSFGMMDFFDDDEDDEESDDDDDDDDDGHSSMLSNASLRRSKVAAGGYHRHQQQSSTQSADNNKQKGDMVAHNPPGKKYYLQQHSSIAFLSKSKTLSLRGGAGVSDLGSEFAKKLLVTALVTLVYEFMIGHSLEFIKVVMQTSPDGTSYGTVLDTITAEKGIGGLWDGFCPWGVIQSIFKGSVFGLAHAVAASALIPLVEAGTIPMQGALTLAGGIGGGFQGFALSPLLLLKTRVMTNPIFRERMSLLRTTWLSASIGVDVVATEGVGALMKGSGVFSTKRVCDWASRYYFSDLFESLALKHKGSSLTLGEKMACSLLGGTASTFVTLPLDVLVAKIQDAKKAGVNVSAWKMFQEELDEKGWSGLKDSYMKGFEARLLHVALTTVAIKTATPIAYDLLFLKQAAATA